MNLFKKEYIFYAPCDGTVMPLDKVPDPAFKSGAIGSGIAINPSTDEFYSPVNGKLVTIFPTLHAFGFRLGTFDILLHIGINTVKLNKKYFESDLPSNTKKVKTDTLLCTCDTKKIKAAGYSPITPLVITIDTMSDKKEIEYLVDFNAKVKAGTPLFKLVNKKPTK